MVLQGARERDGLEIAWQSFKYSVQDQVNTFIWDPRKGLKNRPLSLRQVLVVSMRTGHGLFRKYLSSWNPQRMIWCLRGLQEEIINHMFIKLMILNAIDSLWTETRSLLSAIIFMVNSKDPRAHCLIKSSRERNQSKRLSTFGYNLMPPNEKKRNSKIFLGLY